MLEGLISFAWYGSYYEGDIGNMLARAEQAGIFSYVLPFLLIFALVNGILTRVNVFNENKAINAIISLVVGLLALQFDFVPRFFAEIFPRLGVGLAIILVILIIVGLFIDPENKGIMYTLLGIGGFIMIIILVQSGLFSDSYIGYWFYDNWSTIAWVVGIVVAVAIIASASSGKRTEDYIPYLARYPATSKKR